MENKKSNLSKILLFIIIILVIVMGILFYNQKVNADIKITELKNNINELEKEIEILQEDEIEVKVEESKVKETVENQTYNVNDYVLITNYGLGGKEFETLKEIKFKTLPLRSYTEFKAKNFHYLSESAADLSNSGISEFIKASNEVVSEIDNNILSVYTEEFHQYEYDQTYNFYSMNVNLDTNKIINNQELLELYNIDPAVMFEKIIKDISNNVTVDEFLLDTHGNINAEKESVKNFRNKAKTYAKYIDNRYDVVSLYIKEGEVYAAYDQTDILSILGMGTHMGMGLERAPQSVKIN